jgi:hypothetical protein
MGSGSVPEGSRSLRRGSDGVPEGCQMETGNGKAGGGIQDHESPRGTVHRLVGLRAAIARASAGPDIGTCRADETATAKHDQLN